MLAVTQLAGFGIGAGSDGPASMVFNNTDEYLTKTITTSGASTNRFTFSFWIKTATLADEDGIFYSTNSAHTNAVSIAFQDMSGAKFSIVTDVGGSVSYWNTGDTNLLAIDNTWQHFVLVFDSPQATAANRILMWKNGAVIADSTFVGQEPQNAASNMFVSGNIWYLGNNPVFANFNTKKLAFIDLLQGTIAAPTDFAFNNGGVWTRKPFAGTRGPYGFALTGLGGLGVDLAGGMNFTPVNMDASNLDFGDLPPFIL